MMTMKAFLISGLLLIASLQTVLAAQLDYQGPLKDYRTIVYMNYQDTYKGALALQRAIEHFLAEPTEENFATAKAAWLAARTPYSETEVFRFYEGPIDGVINHVEGPESRLNAWPLNEAYIDYVRGNPNSGLIQNTEMDLSLESIMQSNQADDEANVANGYHAIEFLLWGQDFSTSGPGLRKATDYAKQGEVNQRRRIYLQLVTEQLVADVKYLLDAWKPEQDNFAKTFAGFEPKLAMSKVFKGLVMLSGFEMASERIATALDSGMQEDEHSCFSDNTHNDFLDNLRGIENVYRGQYGTFEGKGINQLVRATDAGIDEKIESELRQIKTLLTDLEMPIDQILVQAKTHKKRQSLEAVVTHLQMLAEHFKAAAKALELDLQSV